MNKKKIWNIEKDNEDNFFWKLDDGINTSKMKIITLNCDNIEWVERYIYDNVEIKKIHYYEKGYISIPVNNEFDINIFKKGLHHFSIYDLDGMYSFIGGYIECEPDEDELIDSYGDDVFDLLDAEGTDSSTIILSGIKVKK